MGGAVGCPKGRQDNGPAAPTAFTTKLKRRQRKKAKKNLSATQEKLQATPTIDNEADVHVFYSFDDERYGMGSYASCYRVFNKSTWKPRLIKKMSKGQTRHIETIINEVNITKSLDHPHIVQYYETFEDDSFVYMVIEILSGGELADRLLTEDHFTERRSALIVFQLLRALTYMHSQNICHRDLKTENMVFQTNEAIDKTALKIIDFGLATTYSPGEVLTYKCGSPFVVAPQVLKGQYTEKCDLWSVGIIMYACLVGYPPFYGSSDADIVLKVRMGTFTFNKADWESITFEAKDLICRLLAMDEKCRPTAFEALHDKWINMFVNRQMDVPLKNTLAASLRTFASFPRLKRFGMVGMAKDMTKDELKPQIDTFNALDLEGDGQITYEEVVDALTKAGIKNISPDLKEVLQIVDLRYNGLVEFSEFLGATMDKRCITEEMCWSAFRNFDRSGDGSITAAEVWEVLNKGILDEKGAVTKREVNAFMEGITTSVKGRINFPEFHAFMTSDNELIH